MHAADSNMIDMEYIDRTQAVLLGKNPVNNQKVIITFSPSNGVQTRHYQHPNCDECKWVSRCRNRLIMEAEERDIQLTTEERQLSPSKLANRVFSAHIPEL
jgi:hypothetical protein